MRKLNCKPAQNCIKLFLPEPPFGDPRLVEGLRNPSTRGVDSGWNRRARSGNKSESGQALITLLFFIVIAVTITSAAIIIIMIGSLSATKFQEGTKSYYVTESGIENALLRLLRDPNYTGETMAVGAGTVTITVTGSTPYTITAVGDFGDFSRTIRATATYATGILTVNSWEEI